MAMADLLCRRVRARADRNVAHVDGFGTRWRARAGVASRSVERQRALVHLRDRIHGDRKVDRGVDLSAEERRLAGVWTDAADCAGRRSGVLDSRGWPGGRGAWMARLRAAPARA